jgi:hypothetical protein
VLVESKDAESSSLCDGKRGREMWCFWILEVERESEGSVAVGVVVFEGEEEVDGVDEWRRERERVRGSQELMRGIFVDWGGVFCVGLGLLRLVGGLS